MAVHVATPAFEGPIEVLLQLVGDQRVDIYDVSLGDLAAAFVARASEEQTDLDEASEFLLIAAILVELKTRRLLPGPDAVDDDEELSGFDERDRLLARLVELQAFAAAGEAFALLTERAARSLPRTAGLEPRFRDLAPDLLAGVSAGSLAAALRRVLQAPPPPGIDLSHVTVEAVTVSEAVTELEERLPREGRSTFRSLTSHCTTKMQVIVRFLALLELFKRGWVVLDQGQSFGDLVVAWSRESPEGTAADGDEAADAAMDRPGALSRVGAASVEEYEG